MPDVTVSTAPYVEYYNGLTIVGNYGLLKILRERPLRVLPRHPSDVTVLHHLMVSRGYARTISDHR
jgi:hypothetical protein